MMTVKEMLGILSKYLIVWVYCSTTSNHLHGLIIDSITMRVYPTSERIEKIIHTCQDLLECPHATVREVVSTLGLLISNFPAAKLGPLHFRALDIAQKLRPCA